MKTTKYTPGPAEQRAIDSPDDITVRLNETFKHNDGEEGDIAFIALDEIITLRRKSSKMAAEIERLKGLLKRAGEKLKQAKARLDAHEPDDANADLILVSADIEKEGL